MFELNNYTFFFQYIIYIFSIIDWRTIKKKEKKKTIKKEFYFCEFIDITEHNLCKKKKKKLKKIYREC
jgi:hypothetical protein